MRPLTYQNNALYIEEVTVTEIAKQFGTPCYAYSKKTVEQRASTFQATFKPHADFICYAVKANSNLAILNLLAKLGMGFDIVSGGELERVLAAKGDPKKIVFSGVGKTASEIERALQVGIYCFNVESSAELARIAQIASSLKTPAPFAIRVNPNIPVSTHPYIATGMCEHKFGIDAEEALALYHTGLVHPYLSPIGIACHLGSQVFDVAPYIAAFKQLLSLCNRLVEMEISLIHIDLGGGFGVAYQENEAPLFPGTLLAALEPLLKSQPYKLLLEPGRSLIANAGILITQVEYLKSVSNKNFAIVDAGMNDLLRPSLYGAWQEIVPVLQKADLPKKVYDIVGPLCETADWLGKDRTLAIEAGSLLAICKAGAYGFTMSSNYNSRCRPVEVLVDGQNVFEIRARETVFDLFSMERLLSAL